MEWKLFIDDERFPKKPDCLIARTSREAQLMVEYYGVPKHIDFDHDLGTDRDGNSITSMEFVRWFEDSIVDGYIEFPVGFTFAVHSQNPEGAKNIRSRMEQLVKHFGKE